MTTFAVKFLGCKVSQADAMLARSALLAAGHTEAAEADAQLHVINTCCITSEAEAKSRQSVRRSLASAREVYVSGCAANLNAAQFATIDRRVRVLVGTAEDAADELAATVGACADLEHDVGLRDAAGARSHLDAGTQLSSRTRGFVKVQDGCGGNCSYCIIPTVRGRARSRSAAAVVAEVRRRVALGQPEIVITGISVGDYRAPDTAVDLGALMIAVARVEGVERVRLSSVEVIHLSESLIAAIATEPNVCPHLHVPMQSGDDRVLAAMGRHYTVDEYLAGVQRVRQAVPELNVTTDVIVGFPTEDERAFERTLEAIDAAGISRVHAFSYSERPGTVAQTLGDLVAPEVKRRRSVQLRGHSEARSRRHRARKLGSRVRVLIDKTADVQCSGYSDDYTRCYLSPDAGARGRLVDVTCAELYADGIRCG
jgi:threonylcarbamoyladenosine tRNA methylthiotransferase MtaB